MAEERGLVITVVIAAILATVFIGLMALATNDTDDSLQYEPSISDGRHVRADSTQGLREPGTYEVDYRTALVFIDPGFP